LSSTPNFRRSYDEGGGEDEERSNEWGCALLLLSLTFMISFPLAQVNADVLAMLSFEPSIATSSSVAASFSFAASLLKWKDWDAGIMTFMRDKSIMCSVDPDKFDIVEARRGGGGVGEASSVRYETKKPRIPSEVESCAERTWGRVESASFGGNSSACVTRPPILTCSIKGAFSIRSMSGSLEALNFVL